MLKVVNTNPIMFHIEIIFQLAISFVGHVHLPEIISTIVSKEKARTGFHPIGNFNYHLLMFLGNYGRENENH